MTLASITASGVTNGPSPVCVIIYLLAEYSVTTVRCECDIVLCRQLDTLEHDIIRETPNQQRNISDNISSSSQVQVPWDHERFASLDRFSASSANLRIQGAGEHTESPAAVMACSWHLGKVARVSESLVIKHLTMF